MCCIVCALRVATIKFNLNANFFVCVYKLCMSRDRIRTEPEDSSIAEVMNWYTAINRALLHHLSEQIKETDNSGVWR